MFYPNNWRENNAVSEWLGSTSVETMVEVKD